MKIHVVVPDRSWKQSAGARIRYLRIAEYLPSQNSSITLNAIDQFDINAIDPHSVVIITKVMDARAIALADYCKQTGITCGVDLFDNYFSQDHRVVFSRLRKWLATISSLSSFCLVSTPYMMSVASHYFDSKKIFMMPDTTSKTLDFEKLARLVNDKLSRARGSRQMKIAWFGMGDNPYFDVGLTDLWVHASDLLALKNEGYDIHVNILTNQRALSSNNLRALNSLPIQISLDLWTLAKEQSLLSASFASFIPIGTNSFSKAKTLNRCLTSIENGCQVITPGFDLYNSIDSFVYRSSQDLANDLRFDRLRISPQTLDKVIAFTRASASSSIEAERLVNFLQDTMATNPSPLSHLSHKTVAYLVGLEYTKVEIQSIQSYGFLIFNQIIKGSPPSYSDGYIRFGKMGIFFVMKQNLKDLVHNYSQLCTAKLSHDNEPKGYISLDLSNILQNNAFLDEETTKLINLYCCLSNANASNLVAARKLHSVSITIFQLLFPDILFRTLERNHFALTMI